jgi:hypothetical protein
MAEPTVDLADIERLARQRELTTEQRARIYAALPALVEAVEAAHKRHVRTGFCPLCDAGPPPHHNEGCTLAAFSFGGSGGNEETRA